MARLAILTLGGFRKAGAFQSIKHHQAHDNRGKKRLPPVEAKTVAPEIALASTLHKEVSRNPDLKIPFVFPLAVIFFCRSACLSGQTGGGQLHRQTVQLGQNFKGLQNKSY
jgi:hypothetical protein